MSKKMALAAGLALIFALLGTSIALAGYKNTYRVSILTASRFASGSLGSARNSPDPVEEIACNRYVSSANGGSDIVYCYARDAQGNIASCLSTDPKYIRAVDSISDGDFINFGWDGGTCTSMEVFHGSGFEPKQP